MFPCVMLSTTIPVSSAQMTTMPCVTPDATPKGDGQAVSFPFKDLLLGLHTGEGVTLSTAKSSDPVTVPRGDEGSSTDLASLVVGDGNVPLPAPQITSNSTEKDATSQDAKPSQDCPCVSQSSAKEPQEVAVASAPKEPEAGKSDGKTGSLVATKTKPVSKRITASEDAVTTVPVDVTAMKVIAATGDCNVQPFPMKTAQPTKFSAEPKGTQKLLAGSAMTKSSSVKFSAAIPLPTPQGDELTDQADNVVASFLSSADDQNSSHESIAVEGSTKAVRVTGLQEASLVVSSSPPPAVVFHASLVREAKSNDQVTFLDNESTSPGTEALASSVASAPVSHLDLQWKDGALGNVSVRAEMREGALHAIVNSSHASSTVSTSELHQFLEESRIPVHSLQVNGAVETKHIAPGDRGPSNNFDANTSSGSGTQASLSYRDESSRSSTRSGSLRSKANEGDEAAPVAISPVPITFAGQAGASRLSIHI